MLFCQFIAFSHHEASKELFQKLHFSLEFYVTQNAQNQIEYDADKQCGLKKKVTFLSTTNQKVIC